MIKILAFLGFLFSGFPVFPGTNIILIGAPGSGKGTLGQFFRSYGYLHLSTGDILRQAVKDKTALGIKYEKLINKGVNLPWEVVDEIMLESISTLVQEKQKFILDGYPRSLTQFKALEKFLQQNHISKIAYVYISVDPKVAIDRILNRKICSKCFKIYNLVSSPLKNPKICDDCGSAIISRSSDTRLIVEKRIQEFEENSAPILKILNGKENFYQIDGNSNFKELSDIYRRLKDEL